MNAARSRSDLLLKVFSVGQLQRAAVPAKLVRRTYSNVTKEKDKDLKSANQPYAQANSQANLPTKSVTNWYTTRTHNCGEVSNKQIGQSICLAGWIQFSRFAKFFVLRDRYGSVQLVVKDKQLLKQLKARGIDLKHLRLESVIAVKGEVMTRPAGEVNSAMSNGDIEIDVKELNVVNECENLSINFNSLNKTPEDVCLKHRYVHLRAPNLQRNLQFRCDLLHRIRRFLIEQLNFIELETPTLFKNTPGGANEFPVPTRFKDKYYTLTQSPQQFKQLLMIASFDKYFQIARCYRDERTRSDRQPEFTQLDLELSFTTSEHVQQLIEDLLVSVWPAELESIRTPFPRISYAECMAKYGIDKPDLRLRLELDDLSEQLAAISEDRRHFKAFAIRIRKGALLEATVLERIKAAVHEKLNHHSKSNQLDGYLLRVQSGNRLVNEKIQPINELLDEKDANNVNTNSPANDDDLELSNLNIGDRHENDCFILCIGDLNSLKDVAGKIRNAVIPLILGAGNERICRANGLAEDKYVFTWVVDFPLFCDDENGNLEAHHHPFTAPIDEHKALLATQPRSVTGQHYDLVLNGSEIAGGSIRIHDPDMQWFVFEQLLKSNISQMSYFLEALKSGCPPHGGIAIGLDRLLSIMLETESIRDVIAFPKTTLGRDPMSEAPNELSAQFKAFYHLT